jgi:hypothetical protein
MSHIQRHNAETNTFTCSSGFAILLAFLMCIPIGLNARLAVTTAQQFPNWPFCGGCAACGGETYQHAEETNLRSRGDKAYSLHLIYDAPLWSA